MYFSIVNKAFLSYVSGLFDFTELNMMRRKICVIIHVYMYVIHIANQMCAAG